MKKVTSLFLTLFIIIGVFTLFSPISTFAALYSGSCGTNLTWILDTDDGVLKIGGTGDMADYDYGDAPWYSNRGAIKKIEIKSGVTSIGSYAFARCSVSTTITISDSVTAIGDSAFYRCEILPSIAIPSSITSIGNRAFAECWKLNSITIPNSVTSIGNGAFSGCDFLASVILPTGLTSIASGTFEHCYRLTSITIPSGVTSIGNSAFQLCSALTELTIPSGVTSIGNSAFSDCRELESITIPSGVTSIGDWAFSYCSKLESITFYGNAPTVGSHTFSNTPNLKTINYFDMATGFTSSWQGIETVTKPFFVYTVSANNATITGVNIPFAIPIWSEVIIPSTIDGYSVTELGASVFYNRGNIESVTIPNTVTKITGITFKNCPKLTSITFNGNAPTVSGDIFENTPADLKVYYYEGAAGFTNPWLGKETVMLPLEPLNMGNIDVLSGNKIKATVFNGNGADVSGTLLAGVYENGKLIEIKYSAKIFAGNQNTEAEITFDASFNNNRAVKVFVWKNFENQKAISNSRTAGL